MFFFSLHVNLFFLWANLRANVRVAQRVVSLYLSKIDPVKLGIYSLSFRNFHLIQLLNHLPFRFVQNASFHRGIRLSPSKTKKRTERRQIRKRIVDFTEQRCYWRVLECWVLLNSGITADHHRDKCECRSSQ